MTIAAFNGASISSASNGNIIDAEWSQGPLTLNVVGDSEIDPKLRGEACADNGLSEALLISFMTTSTCNAEALGRPVAPRLTIIGGQNVGRGTDGIVCFGAL